MPAPDARRVPPQTRAAARLDPLSEIDHDGFHRQLHQPTPTTPHGRQRQARRIGESYAARWWNAVNDEAHDQLLTRADRTANLPDDLHLDLLLFAERNGLDEPDDHEQYLLCGFWAAIRERRPLLAADRTERRPRTPRPVASVG